MCGWESPRLEDGAGALGCGYGDPAEFLIENNLGAPTGGSVEEVALGYRDRAHFLEAHGLGAELDIVGAV